AEWDAVGVAQGEAFWFLPQTALAAVPWFGIAPEGVPAATFEADQVEVVLVGTAMPADASFASWSTGSFGAPSFLFATSAGIDSSKRIAASHDHVNWGFSRAGTYWLTFVARATRLSDGAPVVSPPATFRFEVAR
ncbi:MAG: choice-of-anchor M domain-containing protein, partial [Deltaproteobacteria bacterium]|nr:choice-of-anchor M domain-containing protein [Deltaproteobacteria bacterium]